MKESDRLNAQTLRDRALTFVATHMHTLKDTPEFSMLKISSPRLLEKILVRVKEIDRSRDWSVDRQMSARKVIELEVLDKMEQKQQESADEMEQPFPWLAIVTVFVGFALFYIMINNLKQELRYLIPFLNIAVVMGLGAYMLRTLSN